MPRIVEAYDPNLVFHGELGITSGWYDDSRIFTTAFDRYRSEDLVMGMIGNTHIAFSEVHSEYKKDEHGTEDGEGESWRTIFRGIFYRADFNKAFRGVTVVLPDRSEKYLGHLSRMIQSRATYRGELVRLEDPEFERAFVVYSDDQVEARYLLSTSLMSRVRDFRRRIGCEIHLSFAEGFLNLAIPSRRNRFEPQLFSTLVDFEWIGSYFADVEFFCDIVEDLDLNLRIWTKA